MFDWLFNSRKIYFIEYDNTYRKSIKVSYTYTKSSLQYVNLFSTITFDDYLDAVRYGNTLADKHSLIFLDRTVE
jgi:hypothetical protein